MFENAHTHTPLWVSEHTSSPANNEIRPGVKCEVVLSFELFN